MILRRERTHLSGASNVSIHEKLCQMINSSRGAESHRDSRSKSFRISPLRTQELVKRRIERNDASPIDNTKAFYKTHGKNLLQKTLIGYPKTSELEETEKRKPVFNGDSELMNTRNLFKNIANQNGDGADPEFGKDKYMIACSDKDEGQLQRSNMIESSPTKNLSLQRVKEAMRTLKTRYPNPKYLQRVCSVWDIQISNQLSKEKFYLMARKLGLNLTYEELKKVLGNSNSGSSDNLTLEKFCDIIYAQKGGSLSASNALEGALYDLDEIEDETLTRIAQKQEMDKIKKENHRHQLLLLLKNRIQDIHKIIPEFDTKDYGHITFYGFEQTLRKLGIHESTLSHDDIKGLYEDYKTTPTKFEYRNFLQVLEKFEFPHDKQYPDIKQDATNVLNYQNRLKEDVKEFNIVDCRSLPFNSMVGYFKKARRVSGALKRFIPTKADLNEYLQKNLKLSSEDIKQHRFSHQEFKDIVGGFLDKFNLKHLSRLELEGFSSSVLFNRNGFTNFEEIAKTIYEEEEKDYIEKIIRKSKGPAPNLEQKTDQEDQAQSKAEANVLEDRDRTNKMLLDLRKPSLDLRRNKKSLTQRNLSQDRIEETRDPELTRLLNEFDGRVFVGKKTALRTFRDFDVDGDGYVSHRDITQKLQETRVLQDETIPDFIKYLDPERKGYLNFHEFSSKVRPNMANDDETGQPMRRTVSTIYKPDFKNDQKMAEKNKGVINQLKSMFDPAKAQLKAKTKYGANPAWNNTFLNFQPTSEASMFMSEKDRLDGTASARTEFQIRDKLRSSSIQERRLDIIRKNQNDLQNKISEKALFMDKRDKNNLKARFFNQTVYQNTNQGISSLF